MPEVALGPRTPQAGPSRNTKLTCDVTSNSEGFTLGVGVSEVKTEHTTDTRTKVNNNNIANSVLKTQSLQTTGDPTKWDPETRNPEQGTR